MKCTLDGKMFSSSGDLTNYVNECYIFLIKLLSHFLNLILRLIAIMESGVDWGEHNTYLYGASNYLGGPIGRY